MKKIKLFLILFTAFNITISAQDLEISSGPPKTFFGKGIEEVDKALKGLGEWWKNLWKGKKPRIQYDPFSKVEKKETKIKKHPKPGNYVSVKPIVTISKSEFFNFEPDLTQRSKERIEPKIELRLMYPNITPGKGYISFQLGDFRYSRYLKDITENDIRSIKLISIPKDSTEIADTCYVKKYRITKNIKTNRHFSFVLDHSGSMGNSRADKLQLAVLKAIQDDFDQEITNTKYSVHKFDGFVQKLVTSKNLNEIKKVLDPQNQLDGFGGSTALFTALNDGIDNIIMDNDSNSKILVLFTDGYPNTDNIDETQVILKALLNRVNVVVIGFGSYINENLLRTIARYAGGNYYRIYHENEFEQLYKNVIRDVRISYDVEFSPCMFGDQMDIQMEVMGIDEPLTGYAYFRSPAEVGNSIAVDIRFESGSSKINLDKYRFEIDQLLKFLSFKSDLDIMIEGHTDKQGPENYNQRISEKRAESLKKILISKGIDASRISTVGMGENSPAYSYEYGEEKNELNRRIEIKIQ